MVKSFLTCDHRQDMSCSNLIRCNFFLLFSLTNLSKTELFVPELHILNQKQISTRNCDMKPVSSYTSVSKFQNAFLYKLAKYQRIIVFLSINFFWILTCLGISINCILPPDLREFLLKMNTFGGNWFYNESGSIFIVWLWAPQLIN